MSSNKPSSRSVPAPIPGSSTLSFERILGWIGRFTPQFKFQLQLYQRLLPPESFAKLVEESLQVYRTILVSLAQTPAGAERARAVHRLIDHEYKIKPPKDVSCSKGCVACCTTFPKQVSNDEAALLASVVRERKIEIDLENLKIQAQAKSKARGCPFLTSDLSCGVYDVRPAACRKYHVTSPKELCADENGQVTPQIELMPEIITSAALSLPDAEIGFLSEKVLEFLEKTPLVKNSDPVIEN